jgi:hypothetical protein
MAVSRGERWVRAAGSTAAKSPGMVPFSACIGGLFIFLGLLKLLVPLMLGHLESENFFFSVSNLIAGLLFLALTLLWYERLMFYRLVQELEERLAQCEQHG